MPNNRHLTKKTVKGKDGLHPGSRKAGQLVRVQLRTAKLRSHSKLRREVVSTKLHRPLFFLHSLTSPHPLSFASLRALISDVYLTRHALRIAELESDRRAGRPKRREHLELEEMRRKEWAEWQTGFEVPDLTHAPTTRMLYQFVETDTPLQPSHVDLLRQIRLFKDSEEVVLSRPGRTGNMGLDREGDVEVGEGEDWTARSTESEAMAMEA